GLLEVLEAALDLVEERAPRVAEHDHGGVVRPERGQERRPGGRLGPVDGRGGGRGGARRGRGPPGGGARGGGGERYGLSLRGAGGGAARGGAGAPQAVHRAARRNSLMSLYAELGRADA